jgi:hypothetical protein
VGVSVASNWIGKAIASSILDKLSFVGVAVEVGVAVPVAVAVGVGVPVGVSVGVGVKVGVEVGVEVEVGVFVGEGSRAITAG